MPITIPKTRRNLSADSLLRTLRDGFEQIPDHRPQPDIPLRDALLSGFAHRWMISGLWPAILRQLSLRCGESQPLRPG